MIDVRVIWIGATKFHVVKAYDGYVLYRSGNYKNRGNAEVGLAKVLRNHDNWALVDDNNVRVVYT